MSETIVKRTVLIVDDDEDLLRSLPIALGSEEWQCECFRSWKEAAGAVFSQTPPNVAIIDLHLALDHPRDGFRVMEELSKRFPELAIVALTGHEDYVAAAKGCIETGAVQFLRKPVEAVELRERLNQAIWIKQRHVEALKFEQLEIEHRAAARVQALFFSYDNIAVERLEIQDDHRPATSVSGDYFDFVAFPKTQQLFLAIGDAKSHGVPAALSAHMVAGVWRGIFEMAGNQFTPAQAMGVINRVVARGSVEEGEMTLFLACIDVQTRRLSYTRAGHPYPMVLRGDQVYFLEEGGLPLGVRWDGVYADWDWQLEEGDFLLFYSDGLYEVECRTDQGRLEQLGREGLAREAAVLLKRSGTRGFPKRLADRVLELAGKTQFEDDCTVVTIEVTCAGQHSNRGKPTPGFVTDSRDAESRNVGPEDPIAPQDGRQRVAFERELHAFKQMLRDPDFRTTHEELFVAVQNGRVIDEDASELALAERVQRGYPEQFVLIRQVSDSDDDQTEFPSPETGE